MKNTENGFIAKAICEVLAVLAIIAILASLVEGSV